MNSERKIDHKPNGLLPILRRFDYIPGMDESFNRIREHRKRRRLSQAQLARVIGGGMTHQTVSKIENGTIQLTDRYLEIFARALSVAKVDLIVDLASAKATSEGAQPGMGDTEARAASRKRKLLSFWESLTPQQQEDFLTIVDAWARSVAGID